MSKERLTKRTYNPCDECNYAFHKHNQESGMCKLCEFKSYVNLEEQGLLLRLPVAVGETVFTIERSKAGAFYINQAEVLMFEVFDTGLEARLKFSDKIVVYAINRIFITKNQAEERLANLK